MARKKPIFNDDITAAVIGGFLLCVATFVTNMDTPVMEYVTPALLGTFITFLAIKGMKWVKTW